MIILGIDPGLATVGAGVCSWDGMRARPLYWGPVITKPGDSLSLRLSIIYDEVLALFTRFAPDVLSIEELFFGANSKTALKVGQARGVILLAAERAGVPVFEYTPLQIKQAVTGYGRADKKQVQYMVKCLLGLGAVPKPDDAADALAAAICHAHNMRFAAACKKSGGN